MGSAPVEVAGLAGVKVGEDRREGRFRGSPRDEDEVVMVKNDALNIKVSPFEGDLQKMLQLYEEPSEFEEAFLEVKDNIDVTIMQVVAF